MLHFMLILLFVGASNLCAWEPFTLKKIPQLKNIKYAEKSGLIRRTFKIAIPDVRYPYNPSIIPYKDGYLLAFRHDSRWNKKLNVFSGETAIIELDQNFIPKTPHSFFLTTEGKSAEDPRLFQVGDNIFFTYTRVHSLAPIKCNIAISRIDVEKKKVIESKDLLYNTGPMEKNWTPFVRVNEDTGVEEAYFIYKFAPQRVLKLNLPIDGNVSVVKDNSSHKLLKRWGKKWGEIRGGTPAIRVGNEYLALFHSNFVHKKVHYYVMGAVAFEGTYPFRITRISKHPIFFRNIYETPVTRDLWFYPRDHLRVIFPSGIVEGEEEGRGVYYVVCGENDVAIKCVVLDKEKLLRSLIRLK